MIDAKRFATVYNAFWQSATPTLDLFVRRANLCEYRRLYPPLDAEQLCSRQPLLAEYAFSVFAITYELRIGNIVELSDENIHTRAWREAKARLLPYAAQGLDLDTAFSKKESIGSRGLTKRLTEFFCDRDQTLAIRPCFFGCGYIDMSEGDVLFGSTLYEVKSVDRMIRGTDLRQLLTYAALNKSAESFELNSIGWFNPRRGIHAEFDLEEICLGISGKTTDVLLSEIIETISSGGISR